tara:strand:+ start:334 stop:891 length:558 start_codon:yes stop_codon:yes gene_type:complete
MNDIYPDKKRYTTKPTDINNLKDTDDTSSLIDEYDNNPKDGLFRRYWSNGNLRYEWWYENGMRKDGVSTGWNEDGSLKQICNWKNGVKNGIQTHYHETRQGVYSGNKSYEFYMNNGKKDGVWTTWNWHGQMTARGHYKLCDVIILQEDDGKYINTKESKRHGIWEYWDENGKLINQETYNEGNLI